MKTKQVSLREQLAEISHKQWSGWMEYLFEKSKKNKNGTVTIPVWAVERWTKQVNTQYSELSEKEKDSDRIEADKYISKLTQILEQMPCEEKELPEKIESETASDTDIVKFFLEMRFRAGANSQSRKIKQYRDKWLNKIC